MASHSVFGCLCDFISSLCQPLWETKLTDISCGHMDSQPEQSFRYLDMKKETCNNFHPPKSLGPIPHTLNFTQFHATQFHAPTHSRIPH